jgi:hypothetical protein
LLEVRSANDDDDCCKRQVVQQAAAAAAAAAAKYILPFSGKVETAFSSSSWESYRFQHHRERALTFNELIMDNS